MKEERISTDQMVVSKGREPTAESDVELFLQRYRHETARLVKAWRVDLFDLCLYPLSDDWARGREKRADLAGHARTAFHYALWGLNPDGYHEDGSPNLSKVGGATKVEGILPAVWLMEAAAERVGLPVFDDMGILLAGVEDDDQTWGGGSPVDRGAGEHLAIWSIAEELLTITVDDVGEYIYGHDPDDYDDDTIWDENSVRPEDLWPEGWKKERARALDDPLYLLEDDADIDDYWPIPEVEPVLKQGMKVLVLAEERLWQDFPRQIQIREVLARCLAQASQSEQWGETALKVADELSIPARRYV